MAYDMILAGKLIAYGTGKKHPNGTYDKYHQFPANGIVPETAAKFTFSSKGEIINIVQHFASKGTKVEFGNHPCVHIGSKTQTNYVPLEVSVCHNLACDIG
jgi:hypothetical protein